ncbi:hypothetical protein [Kitasatospora sp. NPDC086791]|uniref:hypothetical protein n=1 Tax=Kitasatospora sp. NPDC086791 TaxID=3155178 RepID=UPI003447A8DB
MTDQPADLLTAAAQVLREAALNAEHVSPAPWTVSREPNEGAGMLYAASGVIVADRSCDDHDESVDLPYIALMHPATGLAVARMLDQAAEALAGQDVPDDEPALAVARAVLGQDGGQQ